MSGRKQQFFDELVKKTKELGREVTFQEMEEDPGMPSPNNYAYYYGSFSNAAKVAHNYVLNGGKAKTKKSTSGVSQTSGTRMSGLSPEREAAIIEEFVDMYIAAGGEMPSLRKIKKNPLISEKEVAIARKTRLVDERVIRRLAEEKTGRKFMSQHERRTARQRETISAKKEGREMNENAEETKTVEKIVDTPKSRKRWSAKEVAKAVATYWAEHEELPPARRYNDVEKEFGLPPYTVIRRILGNDRERWLDVASAILNDGETVVKKPEPKEISVQQKRELKTIDELTELLKEGGALESVIKMVGPIELNATYRYKLGNMPILIKIETEK
ncbi:hypothetical protein IJ076_01780 [Candidatus Saccharibacteria bacterium]|nr:hypothetical protein [Candidatus Saccharibacteria bacterium]